MRRSTPLRVIVAVGLALLLGLGCWLLWRTPSALVNEEPGRLGPTREANGELVLVTVDEGDSARDIGHKLEDAGVIESARLFQINAALLGVSDSMAAGDYEFARGETAMTAVLRISKGITASNVVTVQEGLRSEQIGQLLEQQGVVSAADFQAALGEQYNASFLAALPPGAGLEGFLFPATYGFPRTSTAHEAVQQFIDAFEERYTEEIQPRLGTRSLYDTVTLASIVEREAVKPEERPIIASVFLNRLAQGMALGADPTVQYAIAGDPASVAQYGYWKQELSLDDLAVASPYNTYVNAGLPPGPIANPGLDSILAVLEPADTDYLYFVARPDGSHAFAATAEEHQRNVCSIDPSRPDC